MFNVTLVTLVVLREGEGRAVWLWRGRRTDGRTDRGTNGQTDR